MSRLGGSTVAKNPLQDFWAKRGGGRLFDMGGSTVIYGKTTVVVFDCTTFPSKYFESKYPAVNLTLTFVKPDRSRANAHSGK